eukprot:Phypoly_transcript_00315.p1 GENE.Phypoly_transcript_00315~~Phypoly_transcript_00315.p1  ORF type:complete len:1677 (+),score=283.12 Phypoly_transcript_00315:184-5214(+)
MWSVLQTKLINWVGIVLGNPKYAKSEDLFKNLAESNIWQELLAVLDPAVKINGKTSEERFAEVCKLVSLDVPKTDLKNVENNACMLEALVRLVWKYHVSQVDTLKDPALSWAKEFIASFPVANVARAWPAGVRMDEQLGPMLDVQANKAAATISQNPVLQQIREDALYMLRGGIGASLDDALTKRLLTGMTTLEDQKPIAKLGRRKLVRLFTSSTFTDTEMERNKIMAESYPFLRSICQLFGYGFEVVDMRWGVREFSDATHATGELCIGELHKCLDRSTGPAFITFLGDKYGFRPFPKFILPKILEKIWDNMKAAQIDKAENALKGDASVPADFFQNLRKIPLNSVWPAVEGAKLAPKFVEKELLLIPMWYRLDANQAPPTYVLENKFVVLPDFNNPDSSKKREAGNKFWRIFSEMQSLFRANLAGLSKEEQTPFIISITEEEVRNGILDNKNAKDQSFGVMRNISGVGAIDEKSRSKFIDVFTTDYKTVDQEAGKLLQALKKEVVANLGAAKITTYDLEGKQVEESVAAPTDKHKEYLTKFRDSFTKMIATHILDAIKKVHVAMEPFVEEVIQHQLLQESKVKAFFERPPIMDAINAYLSKPAKHPLIISGDSGSGKTFCVAGAIQKALAKSKEASIVYRFLGTSPKSSNLRQLLQGLCQQLAFIAGEKIADSSSILELSSIFATLLGKASSAKPVYVFLDSLDQLTGDGAGNFDWIPRDLPQNVFLVLSVYSESLASLEAALPDHSLVKITKLGKDEGVAILDKWLANDHRALTPQQKDLILTKLQAFPTPLFLKLCYDISSRWRSYTPIAECELAVDVKGLINKIFERLEIVHGKKLLSFSLGCITASKEGLTYPELEDLLACSERVLEDTYQWWTPPLRRFPPLIWLRINDELSGYLVERSSGSSAVYGWYHRQFAEVARERYLANAAEKTEYHRAMTLYFGGLLDGDVPKPFIGPKNALLEEPRYVQPQPLAFSDRAYNLRKLIELPRHQTLSGLTRRYEDTLFNFDFIHAKCAAGLIRGLVTDYEEALAEAGKDKILAGKLGEFASFIQQNLGSLAQYPTSAIQFAVFQNSALFPTQQAISASKKGPVVIWRNKREVVNPTKVTLPHDNWVTAAALSKDFSLVATADSGNHNIFVWEFLSGKMITCLVGNTATVNQLRFLSDSHTLLSFSVDRKLRVWDAKASRLVHTFDGYLNLRWPKIDSSFTFVVSADEKFAASGYANTVEIWDLQKHTEAAKLQTSRSTHAWDAEDTKVVFSPKDSNIVATGVFDESDSGSLLGVWNVQQGAQIHDAALPNNDRVIWIVFTEQANSLLVGTESRFHEWENFKKIENKNATPEFHTWKTEVYGQGRPDEVTQDGKYILLRDEHQLAIIDKVLSDRARSSSSPYRALRAAISPKGEKAAIVCSDNVLRVINGRTGDAIFEFPVQTQEICYPNVAFANEDTLKVIVGVQAGVEVRTHNANNGKEAAPLVSLKSSPPDSVKLSSTGAFAVVSVRNAGKYEVVVYSSHDLKPKHNFTSPDDRFSVIFSSDDKSVAFAQGTNLQTFNTETFAVTQTFHPEYPLTDTFAVSTDLKHLATIHGSEFFIFNMASGTKITTKTSLSSYYMTFSNNGEFIISYSFLNQGLDIISCATGAVIRRVRIDRGISYLLISGTVGLARDKEGNNYLLDFKF